MEIIGHRGARGLLPQNTLPSFELALSGKVRVIELDTELSRDGRVIIFHDDTVDQITGVQAKGSINSFRFDELRKLNVHDDFEDGKFYQIPTLEEVLDLVDKYAKGGHRARVNIELKGAGTAQPVSKIVNQYLEKGWLQSDFIVSSFRHDELAKFKDIMPGIEVAVLLDRSQWLMLWRSPVKAVELAQDLSAAAINPDLKFVSRQLVKAAHQAGLKVNVYTVNEPKDIRRMVEIGVDGIFTDDFRTVQRVLQG